MLSWLRKQERLSDRKTRLFAVACCRRIWSLLTDERSRAAVEIAERYADGLATEVELEAAAAAASKAWNVASCKGYDCRPFTASMAAYNVAIPIGWWGAAPAFVDPHRIVQEIMPDPNEEASIQCGILRDIFGPPSREARLDSSWLTASVVALATAAYAARTFNCLPELADLLEEAGCDEAELHQHLRSEGPHFRGCFAIDAVLGKR
jgi:hypothetical protein